MPNTEPKVSIIIPCYNHGKYIGDTLDSISKISSPHTIEVIIVNDGSTDEYTNTVLKEYAAKGYHVIFQQNAGLATARNNGIKLAKGEYILPVDADNMIRPAYIEKGISILDNDRTVSIVYGDAERFGAETGKMVQGPYNMQRLMLSNFIDACAMYRKSVWEANNGYDKNMPFTGIEDWDMWLNASFRGFRFRYVDEVLFDYRVLPDSMIKNLKSSKNKGDANLEYLMDKYPDHFGPQFIDMDIMNKMNQSVPGFLGKLILKKFAPATFNKKVKNGSLRKYI